MFSRNIEAYRTKLRKTGYFCQNQQHHHPDNGINCVTSRHFNDHNLTNYKTKQPPPHTTSYHRQTSLRWEARASGARNTRNSRAPRPRARPSTSSGRPATLAPGRTPADSHGWSDTRGTWPDWSLPPRRCRAQCRERLHTSPEGASRAAAVFLCLDLSPVWSAKSSSDRCSETDTGRQEMRGDDWAIAKDTTLPANNYVSLLEYV